MDQTATIQARYTTDILVPVSEALLADLAPDALEDLHGLSFWKVTEWHPLWNKFWRSIVYGIEQQEAAKGRHVRATEFVGMKIADTSLSSQLALQIGVRVVVEEKA